MPCRSQYCSNNAITTIVDIRDGIYEDLFTVIRLIAVCFGNNGLAGCMCSFISTLEPEWRKVSTSRAVRCENGDPFELIVMQLNSQIIDWSQWAVNQMITGINNFLTSTLCDFFGVCPPGPFDLVCFGDPRRPKKCEGFPGDHPNAAQHFAECEDPSFHGGLDLTCYYHRVHTICSDEDMLRDYNGLFDKGYQDIDELQSQFNEAFGQSYAMMDPTLLDLVNQAHISTLSGPDLEPRRDICSSEAFASAMTLDQIITSCFFAMVQAACGDEPPTEGEVSFAIELERTSFKLPKVRFNYDVSPPPPPPIEMSAYQELVDDDPDGYIEMRRRLNDLFPALKHVATSSMGASIAGHIADFTVTPQQITRAFLSSRGMEPDSLGARVIESRHTGRWRFACYEMHKFFASDAGTSPGRNSEAFRAGMENQHATHSGRWDRNMFVAAMLEIKLSMTGHAIDVTNFNSIELYDRICGGAPNQAISDLDFTGAGPAGYRVPTSRQYDRNFDSYRTSAGVDVPLTDFAPIVAYGSLEQLRSMRMSEFNSCPEGLYEADGLAYQYCVNNQEYLVDEMLRRSEYAPFRLQRDIWCDPHKQLSIEQAVGNPEYFEEDLYDTEIKDRFSINNLIAQAEARGEENIADKAWVKRSLRSWVYVTSSADRNIRAGMYRLNDIAVFREQECADLPSVQCSAGSTFGSIFIPIPSGSPSFYATLWQQQNWYNREVSTDAVVRINEQLALVDGLGSANQWLSGREALPLYRCSELVEASGRPGCTRRPYQTPARGQCSPHDLMLISRPTAYGAHHWLYRLLPVPSPSPPPPPPNPRPPPAPPSPKPPPSPPYVYEQNEVMAEIRRAEERMCTSVYYLSQATRCERLAIELSNRWLMRFKSPPSAPPIVAIRPSPPPLLPPSPALPSGFAYLVPSGSTLSTYRLPVQLLSELYADVLDDFGYYTADLPYIKEALATTDQHARACLPNSPLFCQTGSLTANCINGGRRCADDASNARDPYIELRFRPTPGSFLWGIHIKLPHNEQLSQFFVGRKRIDLYGTRDEPLPCAQGNDEIVGIPESKTVTIVCHVPTATDLQLYQMSGAYRVRITLLGEARQVWFDDIKLMERPFAEAGVRPAPSPPPPKPGPPPLAPPPPTDGVPPPPPTACVFHPNKWMDTHGVNNLRIVEEPCGVTQPDCCLHMQENGAAAYQIDDAGCCDLIYLDTGMVFANMTLVEDLDRNGAYSARAGTGTK